MRFALAACRDPSPTRGAGRSSWQSGILALALFGAVSLANSRAGAENSDAQSAYERGVEQFRGGNFAAACDLLADSYRLEPLPGVLFTWATCELRADRVASAALHYGEFVEAVSRLPAAERLAEDERREVAERERARILPEVPYLTIVVPGGAQPAPSVRRDGMLLPPSALGVEAPVDPGEHVIDFEGADGARAQQRVVLAKREHKTVVVGFAGPRAKPLVKPTPAEQGGKVSPKREAPTVAPWIYVTGGVAVAGIVTGTIAGVLAIRDQRVIEAECQGPACSSRGKGAADAAQREATVGTVGFGVGLAGVVATAILYLVDSNQAQASLARPRRWAVVAVSPNVLGVGGAF